MEGKPSRESQLSSGSESHRGYKPPLGVLLCKQRSGACLRERFWGCVRRWFILRVPTESVK